MDNDFAAGLFDARGVKGFGLPAGDFGAEGIHDVGFPVGIEFGGDAEEAGVLGGVAPGVDVVNETAVFAQVAGWAGPGGGKTQARRVI